MWFICLFHSITITIIISFPKNRIPIFKGRIKFQYLPTVTSSWESQSFLLRAPGNPADWARHPLFWYWILKKRLPAPLSLHPCRGHYSSHRARIFALLLEVSRTTKDNIVKSTIPLAVQTSVYAKKEDCRK